MAFKALGQGLIKICGFQVQLSASCLLEGLSPEASCTVRERPSSGPLLIVRNHKLARARVWGFGEAGLFVGMHS